MGLHLFGEPADLLWILRRHRTSLLWIRLASAKGKPVHSRHPQFSRNGKCRFVRLPMPPVAAISKFRLCRSLCASLGVHKPVHVRWRAQGRARHLAAYLKPYPNAVKAGPSGLQ